MSRNMAAMAGSLGAYRCVHLLAMSCFSCTNAHHLFDEFAKCIFFLVADGDEVVLWQILQLGKDKGGEAGFNTHPPRFIHPGWPFHVHVVCVCVFQVDQFLLELVEPFWSWIVLSWMLKLY